MEPKGDSRCCMFVLVLIFAGFTVSTNGRLLLVSKPDPDDAVATARWLVGLNSWGVLKYSAIPFFFSFFLLFVLLLIGVWNLCSSGLLIIFSFRIFVEIDQSEPQLIISA